jgi:hypothetical protein
MSEVVILLDGALTGLLEASSVELLECRVALPFSGEGFSLSLSLSLSLFAMNSSHLCPEKRREGKNQTEPNSHTRLQAFLEDRLPLPLPQKNPKSL